MQEIDHPNLILDAEKNIVRGNLRKIKACALQVFVRFSSGCLMQQHFFHLRKYLCKINIAIKVTVNFD